MFLITEGVIRICGLQMLWVVAVWQMRSLVIKGLYLTIYFLFQIILCPYYNQIQELMSKRTNIYQKHTQENRNRLISLVIQNQLSIRKAAEITNIPLSTAKLYVKLHRKCAVQGESGVGRRSQQGNEKERLNCNNSYPSICISPAQPPFLNRSQPQLLYIFNADPAPFIYSPPPSLPSWNFYYWI